MNSALMLYTRKQLHENIMKPLHRV